MEKVTRLGVLTGGGDCPGLNPAIKAITHKAIELGMRVIGIREGWKGLVENAGEMSLELDLERVQHIDRAGGTVLGTSRTNPFKSPQGVKQVQANWKKLGLDALVAIGGEDTLGVAHRLVQELQLPIVGVPKTIDRDLAGTDYSLGFESALQVITDSVDNLRSTAESHGRVFVVEIMGRHAGHLALRGGIAAGVDMTLIPEHPYETDRVCELLRARRDRGERYSIVFVAEGAMPKGGAQVAQVGEKDAFGHVRLGGVGEALASEIQKRTGIECRSVNLSHLQRGGRPVAYDRRMGFYFGTAAVEAVAMGHFGMMASLQKGRVGLVSLAKAVGKLQTVDVARFYDVSHYRVRFVECEGE